MLRSLRIRNFKSIFRAELDFGRANLIVGPNGSGKSNILEALAILAAALDKGLDPSLLADKGVRVSLPAMFKSAFKNTDLPQTFRLEADFENGRYECSIRAGVKRTALEFHSEALYEGSVKVFGRGPNGFSVNNDRVPDITIRPDFIDPSRSMWSFISPFARISDGLRAELDDIQDYSIYAPQTAVMRGVAVDPRVKEPLGLTGAGLAAAFQQALTTGNDDLKARTAINQIMSVIWQPGWADQIQIGSFNPSIVPAHVKSDGTLLYIRDRYMKTNRNFLSAFDASEGTLYLIFVATLLVHPDAPRTFALDNVDGTLNPKLVRRLTDALVDACCKGSVIDERKVRKQVFVTSHHPSSLDSFDIYEDNQAVFVAHRSTKSTAAQGSTKFDRLRPPPGLSKNEWSERTGGKNTSVMLLEGLIPDAL